MGADVLLTQGAKASAAMILTMLNQNNLVTMTVSVLNLQSATTILIYSSMSQNPINVFSSKY